MLAVRSAAPEPDPPAVRVADDVDGHLRLARDRVGDRGEVVVLELDRVAGVVGASPDAPRPRRSIAWTR